MAWEKIEKSRLCWWRSSAWREVPCISLTHTSITLNAKFAELWLQGKTYAELYIDVEGRRLGFKPLASVASLDEGYKIDPPKGKSSRQTCYIIGCRQPSRTFPDLIGRQFRARLNEANGIIEVDLSARNFA